MMQSIGKYLTADQFTDTIWQVNSKRHGDLLGMIDWEKKWKCYEFQPEHATGFDAECLRDIANFLEELTNETPPD